MDKKRHDNAYKYLFKNKRIFLQLLHSFVDLDFVKCITEKDIELFDKSFVSDEFLNRESDLIYKINYQDNEYYIYILVEFQSTPDKSIPVRMFLYIMLLYDLIYKQSIAGKLPNVFPLLLYNGKQDWSVPLNLRDLIDKNIPEKYIPSFEYFLISEKDVADETLDELKNLVAAVFYFEKHNEAEKISQSVDKVIDFLEKENIIDIRKYIVWLGNMFRSELSIEQIGRINSIKEAKSMLSELADKLREEGKQQGIKETESRLSDLAENLKKLGFEKGIEKGIEKTAKKMKQEGFDRETISRITGLSIEEINKL